MHIRRGFLGWGVFLILAGTVPLLVRSGYLTSDQIGRLWELWPLILIGIGVGLILSRTRFDFVGGLIVAATFGLMIGGVLSIGSIPLTSGVCGQQAGNIAFPTREGTFAGSGAVELRLDCGEMNVSVAPGNTWHLGGKDADGHGPDVTSSDSKLTVRSPDHGGAAFFAFGPRDTWDVEVPNASTVDLDLQLNAGEATVDLAGALLGGVDVELNAGSATVDMGSAEAIRTLDASLNAGSLGLTLPNLSLKGSIGVNAGSVRLCVPPNAAVKLHTGENIVSSYDYGDRGLVKDGTTWTTPGFDTATVQIELTTTANAGSFSLDPEDGCD